LHELGDYKRHLKAIKKHEEENKARKEHIKKLKKEEWNSPLGTNLWSNLVEKDPIKVPSLPVALTEELQILDASVGVKKNESESEDTKGMSRGLGGLRTLKPKGSLFTERAISMERRNMIKQTNVEGKRQNLGQSTKRRVHISAKERQYVLT